MRSMIRRHHAKQQQQQQHSPTSVIDASGQGDGSPLPLSLLDNSSGIRILSKNNRKEGTILEDEKEWEGPPLVLNDDDDDDDSNRAASVLSTISEESGDNNNNNGSTAWARGQQDMWSGNNKRSNNYVDGIEAAESSVFGSLVDSEGPPAYNHVVNSSHHPSESTVVRTNAQLSQSQSQVQLKRVLNRAARQIKEDKNSFKQNQVGAAKSNYGMHRSNNDKEQSTRRAISDLYDEHESDLESMYSSILDVSSLRSSDDAASAAEKHHFSATLPRDINTVRSLVKMAATATITTSDNPMDSVSWANAKRRTHPSGDDDGCATIEKRIRQEMRALQLQRRTSAEMFHEALQELEGGMQRAHEKVQTLEEQLELAYRKREDTLARYEGAHAKRQQQMAAENVQLLHLSLVKQCLPSSETRKMIEAPMPSSSSAHNNALPLGSIRQEEILFSDLSLLDKVMMLLASDHDLGCDQDAEDNNGLCYAWYQDLSLEELTLMGNRLGGILELFETAQHRKESTNLRWQWQADAMKQDAASKYVLYCQYGQI